MGQHPRQCADLWHPLGSSSEFQEAIEALTRAVHISAGYPADQYVEDNFTVPRPTTHVQAEADREATRLGDGFASATLSCRCRDRGKTSIGAHTVSKRAGIVPYDHTKDCPKTASREQPTMETAKATPKTCTRDHSSWRRGAIAWLTQIRR
jgi:hypothetical protein